jgi:pilus assembly protein CpaB
MKQKRLIVILSIAMVLGLVAGFLALRFLSERARPLAAEEPSRATGTVVVAATNLAQGTLLRAEDVRAIEWESDVLPEGWYGTPAEVIGRGLITAVAANEPLIAGKLADKDSGGGLPIVIPEGMRALPVRVDEVIGVAGFVLPGNRVDVILVISPDGGPTTSQIILQNLHVLAAGQEVNQDANGTPITVSTVTLLVTPDQAERLTLAGTEGRIQLALRNPLDLTVARTQGVRTTGLIAPQRAAAPTGGAVRIATPPAPRPETSQVELINGGNRTLSTFTTPRP